MNAFEINKFLGAILAALVFVMGLSVLSDIIFTEKPPAQPGWQIAVADPDAPVEPEVVEEEVAFEVLLASADPAAGQAGARVCGACHSFEQGGANGIGPGLWNIVGHGIAAAPGFNYSAALEAHAAEAGEWSYAELDGFLENPQGWVPGTSMGYAGIKDREDRANVIAYLRSVSPEAPPLPEAPLQDTAAAEPEPAGEEVQVAAADPAAPVAADEPAAAAPAGMPAAADVDPFTQLVASADPAAGRAGAAVCMACHTVEAGQPHRLGPNLHGVFRREVASADGFNYSPAMQNFSQTHEAWTVAELDAYLKAPMEMVPGTTMAYAGVKDEAQRAAIIAWLHSISPDAGPIIQAAAPAEAALDTPSAAVVPEADEPGPAVERAVEAGVVPAEAVDTPAADTAPTVTEAPAGGEAAPEESRDQSAAPAEDAGTVAATPAPGTSEAPAAGVTVNPAAAANVEIVNPRPSTQ